MKINDSQRHEAEQALLDAVQKNLDAVMAVYAKDALREMFEESRSVKEVADTIQDSSGLIGLAFWANGLLVEALSRGAITAHFDIGEPGNSQEIAVDRYYSDFNDAALMGEKAKLYLEAKEGG